jgi:S-adenosylmethionine hydrolase
VPAVTLPISLLTDFGLEDEFVGVVKGVIARIAPEVRVIDITHEVPRGDIRHGALTLLRAVQYLPDGVALAVVDPGVGTDRRAIVVRCEWGFFVGPDNGLLAPAVAMVGGADLVVSIEDPRFRLPAHGATFHGRDVFGPAAAVLASGEADPTELGPVVPLESVTPLMLPLVELEDGALRGEVLWVDHFGNAQTNVTPEDLAAIGAGPGETLVIRIGTAAHRLPWVAVYGDVGEGEGLLHVDSYGQIAVAVRSGRADESYPLRPGIALTISRSAEAPMQIQSPGGD